MKNHLANVQHKLDVANREGIAARAWSNGQMPPSPSPGGAAA